jgi:hypothetical protein
MPVLYRGPDAQITHREFICLSPQPQRFAIRELHDVRVVTTGASGASAPLTYSATAGAALLAVTGWPLLGSAPVSMTALAALAVLCAQTAGCIRGRHSYELHAVYRGQWICLFQTSSPSRFGQVKRALIRAFEAGEDQRVSP